jgi:hypothetical protein
VILLHIGLEKTGTSAIQAYLGSHRTQLLDQGLLYPVIAHAHGHHALAQACGFSVPGNVGNVMERFQNECQRWDGTILISSENFYGTREKIARLAGELEVTGHQVQVLMYYREKTQWLHSVFHERSRWGMKDSYEEFATRAASHYEFLPTLWRAEFANVMVKRYRHEMCATFINDIGLQPPGPYPDVRVHVSTHVPPSEMSWGWQSPELAALNDG